jgi:hypothetical protein
MGGHMGRDVAYGFGSVNVSLGAASGQVDGHAGASGGLFDKMGEASPVGGFPSESAQKNDGLGHGAMMREIGLVVKIFCFANRGLAVHPRRWTR